MNTIIKTSTRIITEKIENAAYEATLQCLNKYRTDDDDYLRLAFAEAYLAASKLALGDSITDKQKHDYVKRGFTLAVIKFQG
jgi:hypothetical protein